jgi:2'-5' RNA ligase
MLSLSPASEPIRAFIAVELPQNVKNELARVCEELSGAVRGARWSKPQSTHLTLKFLGNTPEEKIPDIARAMQDAAAGTGPFALATHGLGVFPNPRKARVLWAGLSGDTQACAALAQRIGRAMHTLGFEPENKPFRAHLTLARLRDPGPVPARVLEYAPARISFPVQRVVLFQSTLAPGGAIYTPLATTPLD